MNESKVKKCKGVQKYTVAEKKARKSDFPAPHVRKTKTSGVKTRGNGAAVRGTKARGPMG